MSDDFERKTKRMEELRDQILIPSFYENFAHNGRYVTVDFNSQISKILQTQYAVDTIVQCKGGGVVYVEEKIVEWPGYTYESICLETKSCTNPGREKDGWSRYALSHYLLYAFEQEDRKTLDVYLIDFPELLAWFQINEHSLDTFGPLNTLNRSEGRLAPLSRLWAEVPCRRYMCSAGVAAVRLRDHRPLLGAMP